MANTKPGAVYFRYSHECFAAGDVAAAATQAFTERAHPEFDIFRIDVEVLADAAAMRAHHADRMSFVDEQQRLVPFFNFDEARQIGIIAVHAVNAFDGDQHAAVFVPQFAEQLIERLPIVVRETADGARR